MLFVGHHPGGAMPLPHQLGQANEVVSRGGQRMAQLRHACGVEMGLRRPGNLYDTCIRSRSKTLNRIRPGAAGFDGSNRMSQKARYVRLWCFWAAGGQLGVGSVGSDRRPAYRSFGMGGAPCIALERRLCRRHVGTVHTSSCVWQPLRQAPSERTMSSEATRSRSRRQGERKPWNSDCKASMRS
jgi:hypothetical protein